MDPDAQPSYSPWRSLKVRATAFTLLIFVLGIWSLSYLISRSLQADMQQLLGAQQFSTVSLLAQDVDDELKDFLGALEVAAAKIDAPMMANAVALQTYLGQRQHAAALYNGGIFVTDTQGKVLADARTTANQFGPNGDERDTLAKVVKDRKALVGQPVLSESPKAHIFSIFAPILDARGQAMGVLVGVVDLGKPNFLDKITQSAYGKSGGYVLISASSRRVITATDKRRIMEPLPAVGVNVWVDRFAAGYEGSAVSPNPKGVNVLVSGKGIPTAGWYVLASLPTAEAFAPIASLQQRMLGATLLLTVLTGVLTWLVLRRQLAPLMATANAMTALAHSQAVSHALPTDSQSEIGQLVAGFNHIAQTWAQREAALKASEERWKFAIDGAGDGLWDWDIDRGQVYLSPRYKAMLGYTEDEIGNGADAWRTYLHPDDAGSALSALQRYLDGETDTYEAEFRMRSKDGSWLWIHGRGKVVERDASGRPLRMIGTNSDITERMESQVRLQMSEIRFRQILQDIPMVAVQGYGENGVTRYWNQASERLYGFSAAEVLGRTLFDTIIPPEMHDGVRQAMGEMFATGTPIPAGELSLRRKDGSRVEVFSSHVCVQEPGQAPEMFCVDVDLTERKAYERQLEHIAHFDALTSLPNRVLLADRLQHAMAQTQRKQKQLAVVYLDLDGFKAINDRHGHQLGDQVLVTLAQRMKDTLREGDTIARMGGDEFVAVLSDLQDAQASESLLERMLTAAAAPIPSGALNLQVSASLGVTYYPQARDIDADQLLRQADQAMYQAKLSGKNRYHVFDAEHDSSLRSHHESLERIRLALENHELVLHYQPKVNMHTGEVIGAEALIRWQHPEKGLLAPATFLPVIEDDPLAVDVGEWVMDAALSQVERWRAAGLVLPVSVNIGARQLQGVHFVERLRTILARHPQAQPGCIEMEVLETSALADMAQVSQVIEDCAQMGVRFALDDFGTGYSTLTYLKQLRVALLKIDRSFVRDMLDDADDLAILRGVIGLAAAFKREVIAEGVETVAHGTALLQLGCELGQGYGIARPMPPDQMPAWVASWRPDAAWQKNA
ncbi:bifunctional diguanylate cyclase/phosphodiesterase [Rhodoferax aquaticus]|uniref:EAL domain-containing protein n=1 Tax=Rhodoferax aquaticus TaxID=2527691 RepID=A0A515EJ96_9BURK|nr:EAL domain-containing protein [Rhodoferax aquaticus]QDL52756.1 EAL domain-containing protein [Rhodoferax aquaticus]